MSAEKKQEQEQATQASSESSIKKQKSPWRWLKRLIYSVVTLLFVIVGCVAFLIFTENGLKTINYALKKSPINEMVQLENPTGTLWKGIGFERFYLALNDENYIEVNNSIVHWDLSLIHRKKVTIESVTVGNVDVMLPKAGEPTAKDPNAPPFLPFSFTRGQLPVDIIINNISVDDVAVVLPNLSVYANHAEVREGVIDRVTWAFKDVRYQGLLNIGDNVTLPLNVKADIHANKKDDQVEIKLTNATTNMQIGNDFFDHAMVLTATGSLNDLKIKDNITFNWPNKLAKPVVIKADINIKNQADLEWDVSLFNVSNQLETVGKWSLNRPQELVADLDLYMAELKDSYPELSGSIKGDFSIAGSIKEPLLSGNIFGQNIAGFGLRLDEISVKAEHNEVQTTEFLANLKRVKFKDFSVGSGKIELHAENIEQFDFSLLVSKLINKEKVLVDSVSLKSKGTLDNHDISLKVRSVFNTTDFKAVGHLIDQENEKGWRLDINQLDLYSDIMGRYSLLKPAELKVVNQNITLSQLCIKELPTTVCIQGQKHGEAHFGTLAIRKLQPHRMNAFLPPEIQVNTTADLVIAGQFKDVENFNGIVDASLSKGNVRYRMKGYELNVPLTKTQVLVRSTPKEITTKVEVDWGKYLQIHGGGKILEPFGKQQFDIAINANAPTLNWLLPIMPVLQQLDGKLTANFETTGQLSTGLDLGFRMSLDNGSIYSAEYNTMLKNIALNIILNKGQPKLTIAGGLTAGNGRMTLNGNVDLLTLNSDIKLNGNSLLLADSQNIKVLVSPNLNVVMKDKKLVIKGDLAVPELKYLYKSSEDPRGSVQKVSVDTVVVSSKRKAEEEKKEPPRFWKDTTIDFNVNLGDKVSVGAVGFVGKLTGGVELKKIMGGDLRAIGIINVGSGVYNVLGQELTLDKGRIQFTGLDLVNPSVEFQASRRFDNKRTGSKVNVGVRVTGTAQKPAINLFSQPMMQTNSIVAYLALGSDVDSLTAVEVLQIAKMAQRIASGDIVTSNENSFAKSVGLSDFGVMKDLSGNTSLGIGKYITQNFYMGVGFGLFDENNGAFGLMRYSFLKYFSFDTQVSGEYSTIDLRFSKEI